MPMIRTTVLCEVIQLGHGSGNWVVVDGQVLHKNDAAAAASPKPDSMEAAGAGFESDAEQASSMPGSMEAAAAAAGPPAARPAARAAAGNVLAVQQPGAHAGNVLAVQQPVAPPGQWTRWVRLERTEQSTKKVRGGTKRELSKTEVSWRMSKQVVEGADVGGTPRLIEKIVRTTSRTTFQPSPNGNFGGFRAEVESLPGYR